VQVGRLRPRTLERYVAIVDRHLLPLVGSRRAAQVTADEIVFVMSSMRASGSSEATIRKSLTLLGTIFGHAQRRGWIASNPVRDLQRDERPRVDAREMRVLRRDEIAALLNVARPTYRTLLAAAIFTGLRFGELLGLT
jgi:integrase